MKTVLIIEDDESIANLEKDYLEINGFEVDIAGRGTTGLEMALGNDYSIIIVDIMLPGLDGFGVVEEIRKVKQTPVIFLSARDGDIDKIKGFGLGADDYITKPFSPNELVARVKAHISRYEAISSNNTKETIITDGLKIDLSAKKVYVDGREVNMPLKEFELLAFMAQNANRVYSKEQLFDRIWGMDAIGDVSTVTVHIQRIRDKIATKDKKYIETVWGAGYRFIK